MSFQKGKTKGRRLSALLIAMVMAISMFAGVGAFFAPDSALADSYFKATDAKGNYYPDFTSFAAEKAYAAEHTVRLMEESTVLLKNKNNVLPLSKDVSRISLFSSCSYVAPGAGGTLIHGLIYGGTGSGAGTGSYYTLPEAFADAGYELNPTLRNIYQNTYKTARVSGGISNPSVDSRVEIDVSNINTSAVQKSYGLYDGAFVATISRLAGEGNELYIENVATHTDKTDHYLSLDDNERALLNEMKAMKAI